MPNENAEEIIAQINELARQLDRESRSLTMAEYERLAQRSAGGEHRLERAILGLAGEGGEVAEVQKKYLRGDYCQDHRNHELLAELGDVLWYVAELAVQLGSSLDEVARANVDKLADRYKLDAPSTASILADAVDPESVEAVVRAHGTRTNPVRILPRWSRSFCWHCKCTNDAAQVDPPGPLENCTLLPRLHSACSDASGTASCTKCGTLQPWVWE